MDRGSLPIRRVGSWPRRVGVGGLVGGLVIVVVFASVTVCLWGDRGGRWQLVVVFYFLALWFAV